MTKGFKGFARLTSGGRDYYLAEEVDERLPNPMDVAMMLTNLAGMAAAFRGIKDPRAQEFSEAYERLHAWVEESLE